MKDGLIDRRNLLAEFPLPDDMIHGKTMVHITGVRAAIECAPDVTPFRWIPVTERLPEDDLPKGSTTKQIKVIVAYKRRNCSWVIRTQLRQKGRWYGRPDEWDWSVSDPISHWMPLPEPPGEV